MKYWVQIYDGNTILWETIDSTSHDGEPGWAQVPIGIPREAMKVVEGLIVADEEIMKRITNTAARKEFMSQLDATYNQNMNSLLGGKSESRILSEMMYGMFIYIKSLQESLSVLDASLSQQGQAAKAALDSVASGIYAQIEGLRESKAQSIESYVPPYDDVDPLYQ